MLHTVKSEYYILGFRNALDDVRGGCPASCSDPEMQEYSDGWDAGKAYYQDQTAAVEEVTEAKLREAHNRLESRRADLIAACADTNPYPPRIDALVPPLIRAKKALLALEAKYWGTEDAS